MQRRHSILFVVLGGTALFLASHTAAPPSVPPKAPVVGPKKPAPAPPPKPSPPPKPKPHPGPWGPKPCPKCGQEGAGSAPGKPVIGGRTSPDGAVSIVCDLPASERKKNIGPIGYCVFRSGEYAARWQQIPELYDLPEQMKSSGIIGGGYPEKVDKIFAKFAPNAEYFQDTSGDADILEAVLKTGRLPCVTYCGHDPHYGGSIAHMVCLPYFDRATGWACVMDNNFIAEDEFVWMSCQEFLKRWKGGGGGGWVYALLHVGPPPVPHN